MISPPDMMPILVGIQSIRVDSVPNRGISEGLDGEWDSFVELLQELFNFIYIKFTVFMNLMQIRNKNIAHTFTSII